MTTELFADILPNETVPSLAANIVTTPAAGTSESWSVTVPANLTTLPTLGSGTQMRCVVDSEIVIVTAGTTTSGTQSWTVTRGAESSTIATHASGSPLAPEATAGALNASTVPTTTVQGLSLSSGAGGSPLWTQGYFYATDYGTITLGTGATSAQALANSQAIQKAIDAAATAGGGTVLTPVGVIMLAAQNLSTVNSTNMYGATTYPANYLAAIYLRRYVFLSGQSRRGTTLQLFATQNCHVVTNWQAGATSATGIDANGIICGVGNAIINGNSSGGVQTGAVDSGHGIFLNRCAAATADPTSDGWWFCTDLEITNCHDWGYKTSILANANASLGAGNSAFSWISFANSHDNYGNGGGFMLGTDSNADQCQAGTNHAHGYFLYANCQLSGCKSVFAGRVAGAQNNGQAGYTNNPGATGIQLTGCSAQDNGGAGYLFNNMIRSCITGCLADSNSGNTSQAGVYAGFEFTSSSNLNRLVGCVAFDRNNQSVVTQYFGVNPAGANKCYFDFSHYASATTVPVSAPFGTNGTISANGAGPHNGFRVNVMDAYSLASITATGTYTPYPYNVNGLSPDNATGGAGTKHILTISGTTATQTLTIAAPADQYRVAGVATLTTVADTGLELSIVINNTSTQTWTLAWNAVFKASNAATLTTSLAANGVAAYRFVADGTNWRQV